MSPQNSTGTLFSGRALVAVIAGLASALLFSAGQFSTNPKDPLSILSLFSLFAMAPLLAIGWVRSYAAAALAAAAGLCAVLALAFEQGIWLKYALLTAGPSLLALLITQRKITDGYTALKLLTLYGAVAAGALMLAYKNIDFFRIPLEASLMEVYTLVQTTFDFGEVSLPEILPPERFYGLVLPYVMGMEAVKALFTLLFNGLLVLQLISLNEKIQPPVRPQISEIRLPASVSALFLALLCSQYFASTALGSTLGGFWLILVFPLSVSGLANIHRSLATPEKRPLLWAFYFFFVLLLPHTLIVVSMLGLIQPLIRKKGERLEK